MDTSFLGVFFIQYAFSHIRLRSFFAWMILGMIVTVVTLTVIGVSKTIEDVVMQTTVFFIFPLLWLYMKTQKNNIVFTSFFDKTSKMNWKLILIATAMGMIFSFGVSFIQFYILAHLVPNFIVDILNDTSLMNTNNVFTMIFSFISACIFAPIMEEVIFRGFFLQRMTVKWGIKRAVIISSLIFGLGHFDIVGAFLFGIIMCLLYIKTQNIWMNIAVHALNNCIVTIMQLIGGEEANDTISASTLQGVGNLWVGAIFILISLLWFVPFIRKNWRNIKETGVPPLRFIDEEKRTEIAPQNRIYSQVIITERLMAVELPDEVVNRIKLEENDEVTITVENDQIIIQKAE
ncbi:Abortive infection protein [Bacillus cytotoxicus NVH 391-98]|uniref:Abortive infection protein n=1 Tax=Bacillus cytotoxicus (strain DSM 22905 / CIP 110041 / 391-98 / NVH 391-98) TaxID=315749 RepID=A7GMQ0_BACCN|nr:Abortive infection protein [Bacillus cytotoxicus NVH 391-98]AWC44118.1 CPBP family intramembrane metalloprotease domain-containing protein [Bacillus cytotoxicus]SCN33288.1 Abortive infection protein [Bacillus cytotoxicus]